jgi:hypothetical protein
MRAGALVVALAFAAVGAKGAAQEPICADRPGKANPTCTVPAGSWQIETGLIDWDSDKQRDFRTRDLSFGQTALKFGLTSRSHLELDITPFTQTKVSGAGVSDRVSGVGDLGIAYKRRLTRDSAPVQVALYPFVKIPTAGHALGNGKVEGGTALLVDGSIPGTSLGWNIAPEVDVNANADGSGYHLGTTQALSIGVPLSSRFSMSVEIWGNWDFDPAGTVRQYSADAAAALLVSNDIQLDAGMNVGLNRDTPDLELYSGLALRF